MSDIAAIGARAQLAALALAGAQIHPADTPEQVRAAWAALPAGVAVVVLTEEAALALGTREGSPGLPLTVVMGPWPA